VDEQAALRAIDVALTQNAFMRDWSATPAARWIGPLERHGLKVTVSIDVVDLDFVQQPRIRLVSRGNAAGKLMPHIIGPDGELCYLARNSTVLDRYDPGGTILRCLLQAEKVIGDGLRSRSDGDFVDEFANYWGRSSILVDLPPDFEGLAEIRWIAFGPAPGLALLCAKGQLATSFAATHAANRGAGSKPVSEPCVVVRVQRDLGLDWDGAALPGDLKALAQFLEHVGKKERNALYVALREGAGLSRWIAIAAPNATCIAEIKIPKIYDRQEFMRSRKSQLPDLLLAKSQEVPIERTVGFPVDARSLYERNLGPRRTLGGRTITLIGCGTIGGFLSYNLAQSGAGTLGGRLVLIDNDLLMPSNLGRHFLGMAYLNRNKAQGCAEQIARQLPHVDLSGRPIDALEMLNSISASDLIIDATGEEAFSIALNEKAVRRRPDFPPILHVWIAGNGGSAQALLCDGPPHACYKCQKPKLAGEPRYRVLRRDARNDLRRNRACGDGLFAPFPVSASATAAALALDLVLAWNDGNPIHRFRTRVLNPTLCFQIKDMNLSASDECPACRADNR
jgi:molybdopterin/thiamine biosynthesis adenylyltransferase